jgi:hypothetical protein
VNARHQHLQGLVGARRRGASQAWEVDCLIDTTPEHDSLIGLLECAVTDLGSSGVEKLFLRLSSDSDLLPAVREAGFIPFREEILYARVGIPEAPEVSLRPVNPVDSYPIYRLYNATTPEVTRRNEAATFSEWHASQERRWLRNGVQLASDGGGSIVAVVRAACLSQGVAIDLLVDSNAGDRLPELIRGAVETVSGQGLPVFILTPKTGGLGGRLEDLDFASQGEYVSLLRRTTRPATLPKLTPAVAKTAVGI